MSKRCKRAATSQIEQAYNAAMPFVRKPKPYTRGRGARRFPAQGGRWPQVSRQISWPNWNKSLAPRRQATALQGSFRQNDRLPKQRGPSQVGPSFREMSPPHWLGVLASLGAVICLLIGGSLVLNQVAREGLFQSMAVHLAALQSTRETP